ncbi:MAG: substrate-binding domain-containing protein [Bifidobacterium minimum]|nr:substrate-binding domain-containing protein [Bifidobacterium minimum]
MSSTEDSGWDTSLKKAAQAEIPVFTVDRDVDVKDSAAKKAIVSHIGPSNTWAGQQAAEFVNKNFPDGANGFILEGPAGLSVVKDRQSGWDSKIGSKVKVLESQSANWDTDEAKTVTAGMLDKYKSDDPQFIFAQNDEMGLGAAQAVDAAGLKGKIKIITIDGTKAALQAVVDGDLSYVIEYNPIFGKETANAVKDYLAGKTVKKDIVIDSKTFDAASAKAALDAGTRAY